VLITSSAFSPVNIAWIKYMGKENGQPTNSSLSMTLKNTGTTTRIHASSEGCGELSLLWDGSGYVPPAKGQQKVQLFLTNERVWREAIEALGYPVTFPRGNIEIFTQNNVPAGTGIATSASAFAALTLTWAQLLVTLAKPENQARWVAEYSENPKLRQALAEIARKGSGSSCRSFDGPWVEWHPRTGIHKIETGKVRFVDLILLIDHEEKEVSSSEAHERVKSSPKFLGRVGRVETRMTHVKHALKKDDLKSLQREVLAEALDMHELFHTSVPAFSYLKPLSREWIQMFETNDSALPTENGIMTLDAGANVHIFIPEKEADVWIQFIKTRYPTLKFVKTIEGTGAHYV
jgi:diphosphomevalonate decarboxylase